MKHRNVAVLTRIAAAIGVIVVSGYLIDDRTVTGSISSNNGHSVGSTSEFNSRVIPVPGSGTAAASASTTNTPEEMLSVEFQNGVAMLNRHRYKPAIDSMHAVLALQPAMPEAHVNMGFALVGLHRFAEAGAYFRQAIELRSTQANAYYGLAIVSEASGDLISARQAMRTYLHLTPEGDPYRRKAEGAIWEWDTALTSISN